MADKDVRDGDDTKHEAVEEFAHHALMFGDTLRVDIREPLAAPVGKVFGETAEEDWTGMMLWESSLVMAQWLVANAAGLDADSKVLELGSGCGLGAVVASKVVPAGCVVQASEYQPKCVANLRYNLEHEGLHVVPADETLDTIERGTIQLRTIDWQDAATWPVARSFQLVFGADLVYTEAAVEPLVNVIEHCVAPGGRAFLVCPEGRKGFSSLCTMLQAKGFTVDVEAAGESLKAPCLPPDADPIMFQVRYPALVWDTFRCVTAKKHK